MDFAAFSLFASPSGSVTKKAAARLALGETSLTVQLMHPKEICSLKLQRLLVQLHWTVEVLAAVFAIAASACANVNPPAPERVVQDESGREVLSIVMRANPPVGKVLPVQMAILNPTINRLSLDSKNIRGIPDTGGSVATLSLEAAKQEAGGGSELVDQIAHSERLHVASYAHEPERAEMVAQGCLLPFTTPGGSPQFGAAWIMFVCPVLIVGAAGLATASTVSSSIGVSDVALSSGALPPSAGVSGYIFLPSRKYVALEIPVKDEETGGLITVVQPWRSADDLAQAPTPTASSPAPSPLPAAAPPPQP